MHAPTTVDRGSVARHSHRAPRRAAVLLILAVLVAACTGSPDTPDPAGSTGVSAQQAVSAGPPTPDQWRGQVSFEPLAVPGDMAATADRVDQAGLIAATGDRPALVAAIRTGGDGREHLQMSTWSGSSWQSGDLGPGVPGEPRDASIAGDGVVTAVGGWTWEAGTIWPYLLISSDRQNWTSVELPTALSRFRVTSVATANGRVIALAEEESGNAATVLVDQAGSPPTVTPLPPAPEGQRRWLGSLVLSGETVLLTGGLGTTNRGPTMVFRSPDHGATWAEPAAISTNQQAGIWGITVVSGGFVATGNDLVPDDPDKSRQMAAWFSPDGITWTADTVPQPDGFRWDSHDSALGLPTTAGDYVLALAGSSNSRSARLYQRRPTGEWISIGQTNQVADDVGRLGRVAPIVQPPGSDAPAGVFVAVAGAHGMVVGDLRSGVWTTRISPAQYRDPPYFSEVVHGGTTFKAVVRQRQFLPFGDTGFRTVNEPALIGRSDDTLTVLPWDPPEADNWDDVELASDGGADLVLASRLSENEKAHQIAGWFRPAAGQPWQPVTGFGAQPDESLGGVIRIGGAWLLRGSTNDDVGAGNDQAMLWHSADGVQWARAEGDFSDGDRGSSISEVCADPAGRPVAVGWIYLTAGTSTAAAWTEQNGSWRRSVLPAGPDDPSWFSGCTTTDGHLVIDGSLDGDDGRWTIDGGGSFQPVAEPVVDVDLASRSDFGEPFQLTEIRDVPGGSLAVGRLDVAEYVGPVLWLSADGARWTWVPVPVAQPNSSLKVGVDGPDLIVLSGSTNYSQAWRITDIGSVIASIPTAS